MTNKEKREYISCLTLLDRDCLFNEIPRRNEILRKSPKTLFKYRSFDKYTFEMIGNNYVYLSSVKDLDDPFDCVTDFDMSKYIKDKSGKIKKGFIDYIIKSNNKSLTKEQLEEYKKTAYLFGGESDDLDVIHHLSEKDFSDKDLNHFLSLLMNVNSYFEQCRKDKVFDEFAETASNPGDVIGVCSLSENRDNKVMWSLYGDKYNGYCIEYDIPLTKEVRRNLYPVQYLKKRSNFTKLIYETMMAEIKRNIGYNAMFLNREIDNIGAIYEPFCLKDTDWKYQEEWRIIGSAKGYFTQLHIKAIYLGFKVSQANETKMKRLAKEKNFNLYKMNQPDGKKRITYLKLI